MFRIVFANVLRVFLDSILLHLFHQDLACYCSFECFISQNIVVDFSLFNLFRCNVLYRF